jgi:hypothetical protein
MRRNNFADSLPCRGAGVNRGTNCRDVAAHDGSDQTSVDLFPTDETNVRGFHHRVSRFDHRDQPTTFNQSECFWHDIVLCSLCFVLCPWPDNEQSTKYKELSTTHQLRSE